VKRLFFLSQPGNTVKGKASGCQKKAHVKIKRAPQKPSPAENWTATPGTPQLGAVSYFNNAGCWKGGALQVVKMQVFSAFMKKNCLLE